MKTGVMIYISKYIKREIEIVVLSCNNTSKYNCFTIFFNQINSVRVRIRVRGFKKNLSDRKLLNSSVCCYI